MDDSILVVNCGSSSLKLALFDHDHQKITSALAERLNQSDAFARINGDETPVHLPSGASHSQALAALVNAFKDRALMTGEPMAVGHRVVHGGETFTAETRSGIDASARIRSGVDASASIVTSTGVRPFVERLCVRFQTARQRTSEKRFNRFNQNSSILQKQIITRSTTLSNLSFPRRRSSRSASKFTKMHIN